LSELSAPTGDGLLRKAVSTQSCSVAHLQQAQALSMCREENCASIFDLSEQGKNLPAQYAQAGTELLRTMDPCLRRDDRKLAGMTGESVPFSSMRAGTSRANNVKLNHATRCRASINSTTLFLHCPELSLPGRFGFFAWRCLFPSRPGCLLRGLRCCRAPTARLGR
jgi:hypothetical protein